MLMDGLSLHTPPCKTQLSQLQNDNAALFYTGVIVVEKSSSGCGREFYIWARIATLADIGPNFPVFLGGGVILFWFAFTYH